MKLNHLNLIVTDVAAAVGFFETYFDFKCTLTKGDNVIAILEGTDNFTLVIMTQKQGEVSYPQNFHIGFMLETKEEVEVLHEKLKSSTIPLPGEPAKIRNSYGFYFHFDGIMIEVGHYIY
ncbi:MAG: glyoxalase/bleomycin resistance/extradiol dioxygenase family protein [Bacteroidetes bacterium]|nr:glyoxalase/bleomycin resistance/extradiol dioxygenase family protein [Bacteroidota bacterium]